VDTKVTMAEIAKRLGVSKTTVSLALMGRQGVSDQTRKIVEETAQDMGYQKQRSPISRSSERKAILVIVQGNSMERYITGMALGYINGIKAAAEDIHARVLIDSSGSSGLTNRSRLMLKAKRKEFWGALLINLRQPDDATVQELRHHEIRVLAVNRYWPEVDISFVGIDDPVAEQTVVRYLGDLGHRRIAFAALNEDGKYSWCEQRRQGYEEGMLSIGQAAEPRFILQAANASKIVDALVSQCPETTAICAPHDTLAIELISELQKRGMRVPQDVSIAGFDNDETLPSPEPPLTTIDYDEMQLGYWAVRVLSELHNRPGLCRMQVVFETRIVERKSCSSPRSGPLKAAR
jgi:DNA-binding LacI/PurR family transcriptional regulator